MKNNSIALSTDPHIPVYRVTTDKADHHTFVHDARTQRLVATMHRRELLPDTIVFGSGEKVRVNKWLRKGKQAETG